MGKNNEPVVKQEFQMHTSQLEFVINQIYEVFQKNGLPPVTAVFVLKMAKEDLEKKFGIVINEVGFSSTKEMMN